MNIRESGARSARRATTALGVMAAAVASIIGMSVWVGATASASSVTTTTREDDDGQTFGTVPGFVGPGQGGQSHGNSNGS